MVNTVPLWPLRKSNHSMIHLPYLTHHHTCATTMHNNKNCVLKENMFMPYLRIQHSRKYNDARKYFRNSIGVFKSCNRVIQMC